MSYHGYRYLRMAQYVDLTVTEEDPWAGVDMNRQKIALIAEVIKNDPYGELNHPEQGYLAAGRRVTAEFNPIERGKHPVKGWHGGIEIYAAQLFDKECEFDFSVDPGTAAAQEMKGLRIWTMHQLKLSHYQARKLLDFSQWPIEYRYGWKHWYYNERLIQEAAMIAYRRIRFFLDTGEHKKPKGRTFGSGASKTRSLKGWR